MSPDNTRRARRKLVAQLSADLCKGFLLAGAISYAAGTVEIIGLFVQIWIAVCFFAVAYFLTEGE